MSHSEETTMTNREQVLQPNSDTPRTSLKFGLRSILILTAALGVTFSTLFVAPDAIAAGLILIVTLGLPSCLATGFMYGNDSLRAFSVGAFFPTLLVAVSVGMFFAEPVRSSYFHRELWWEDWGRFSRDFSACYRPFAGAAWGLAILFGLMSLGLRKHLQSHATRD